ncbi:MAG: hypothetical protein HW387_1733 [Parachlamydiales bacterium]|nr:hypothetical protein [Parachlamydiales bacterium]
MATVFQTETNQFVPLISFVNKRRENGLDSRIRNLALQVQAQQNELNTILHDRDLIVAECEVLKNKAKRMLTEAKTLRRACGGVSGAALGVTYSVVNGVTGSGAILCVTVGTIAGIGAGYAYDKFMGDDV